MEASSLGGNRWGIILAGGDGNRLRSLTRFISGDDRPKQFCPLVGGRTLLDQTRIRIAPLISAERTVLVVTRSHESFYAKQLSDVPASQLVIQPESRGTLPAILCALLRVAREDRDAVVGIFPCDHHYSSEGRFMAGVESAFDSIDSDPESVILLGATARNPEVAYGWIEPESSRTDSDGAHFLRRVRRFWEKPSAPQAQKLWEQGCLWNTFVMIGQASAFLALIQTTAPSLYQAAASLPLTPSLGLTPKALAPLYARIEPADFSRQSLSSSTELLKVSALGDVGWSDLGDPDRVVSTLARDGLESSWIQPWHRSMAASAGH